MKGYPHSKISPRRENAESPGIDTSPVLLCHWICDVGNACPITSIHQIKRPKKEHERQAQEVIKCALEG